MRCGHFGCDPFLVRHAGLGHRCRSSNPLLRYDGSKEPLGANWGMVTWYPAAEGNQNWMCIFPRKKQKHHTTNFFGSEATHMALESQIFVHGEI